MSNETNEPFLSRWSRRKSQVRQETVPPAQPRIEPPVVAPAEVGATPTGAQDMPAGLAEPVGHGERVEPGCAPAASPVPQPTLDEAHALTPTSDFTRFIAPGVDAEVKNAAMKKLFTDPHFNVMDGLDTYIDDYGRADPIPKAMLRQMVQARVLGLLDDELEEQPLPTDAVAQAAMAPSDAADPLESALDATDQPESAPVAVQTEAAPDPSVQRLAPLPQEHAAATPAPPSA